MDSAIGAELIAPDDDVHGWAFGEHQSRYILATSQPEQIIQRAADIPLMPLGKQIIAEN